jgi:FkbM family methyltransferase
MVRVQGLWWPDDVGTKWQHSFKHVRSLEWAMKRVKQRRTAVQAGGNVGLWPLAMSRRFERVITFEPDVTSCACLLENLVDARNVTVIPAALGDVAGTCGIEHRSLGSHRVAEGKDVDVMTLDSFDLRDVDLLQLDVEGYELNALRGARNTLARCLPLVQVELRNFGERYDANDALVRAFLGTFGYEEVSQQPGNDFVFEARR